MSFSLSGRGSLKATIHLTLADPLALASTTCGMVLSRYLSGDVPDAKVLEYKQWVGRLILNHRGGVAVVRPDGDTYINALMVYAFGDDDDAIKAALPIARELAEKLCDGGVNITKSDAG